MLHIIKSSSRGWLRLKRAREGREKEGREREGRERVEEVVCRLGVTKKKAT